MNELLRQVQQKLDEVSLKERAHHVSYENHYLRDLWIGGAAKASSAIVGAGVFTALVSQLGLDGKKPPSAIPADYRWLYWIVLFLCVAAPALTAVTLVRHDAQDAEAHLRSELTYHELKGRLEDILRDYDGSDGMTEEKRKEANEKYVAIRERANGASTIGLFTEAVDVAKKQLDEDRNA